MLVLGSWSIGNIIIGAYGRQQYQGQTKYFYEMNASWNVINLSIASIGYFSNIEPSLGMSLTELISEQNKLDKILLFNAGLDVAYITTGLYLNQRGINKNSDRLRGYGKSLMLQGLFLFVFDLGFYYFNNDLTDDIMKYVESVDIGLGTITVRF